MMREWKYSGSYCRLFRMGRTNVSVFPVAVGLMTAQSFPLRICGIACFCIGVGSVMWCALRQLTRLLQIPSWLNVCICYCFAWCFWLSSCWYAVFCAGTSSSLLSSEPNKLIYIKVKIIYRHVFIEQG